ncbi:MAG: alkene reductase [Akkermansiaceae bacterium]
MKHTLFDPIKLGNLELSNRIIMAPLTRCRADEGRVPNAMMAEYYGQRASAGLILAEATAISAGGVGYPDTPGLWSDEQVEGWRLVTEAVHSKGGKIVAQLWHVGRISHSSYLNGELPVAPSAIAPDGHVSLVRPKQNYEVPRPLLLDEIEVILEDYRIAAENAKRAGFDGVEIHGANGYLPEQFLHSSSNTRDDIYGGSLENRARFMLGAIDAALSVWDAGNVGLHVSPQGDEHDTGDSDASETYAYIANECKKRGMAFIFVRESQEYENRILPVIHENFGYGVIANQQLTLESAQKLVAGNKAEAISYGQLYIANPDLVERLKVGAALNVPDPSTFYGQGPVGYTDYPFMG